ncbi:MAG: methyltransferase domain-containing protein [Candidatus Omnitrophica bacterium]|nr:methyltransferase domain-containing protein [Candidatus Omnitrophota bacterium]
MNIIGTLGIRHLLKMKKAHSIGLKYTRGYMVSNCISALSNLGVLDDLLKTGSIDIESYAKNKNLDEKILISVFDYLYSVGIIKKQKNKHYLSKYGKFIANYVRGPFSFMAAYAPLFMELEFLLAKKKKYGIDIYKNKSLVAKASAETEEWVPYPIVKEIIKKYKFKNVLDLGCGSAEFLIKLCRDNLNLTGYGIDISDEALKYAQERIDHNNLKGRINLAQLDLNNIGGNLEDWTKKIDVITSMFVFHEFINPQDKGITNLLNILQQLKTQFKDSYLIICELCKKTPEKLRERPSLIAEHHLFHALSGQVLLTGEEWESIFNKTSWRIVEEIKFDPASQIYFILK